MVSFEAGSPAGVRSAHKYHRIRLMLRVVAHAFFIRTFRLTLENFTRKVGMSNRAILWRERR